MIDVAALLRAAVIDEEVTECAQGVYTGDALTYYSFVLDRRYDGDADNAPQRLVTTAYLHLYCPTRCDPTERLELTAARLFAAGFDVDGYISVGDERRQHYQFTAMYYEVL